MDVNNFVSENSEGIEEPGGEKLNHPRKHLNHHRLLVEIDTKNGASHHSEGKWY